MDGIQVNPGRTDERTDGRTDTKNKTHFIRSLTNVGSGSKKPYGKIRPSQCFYMILLAQFHSGTESGFCSNFMESGPNSNF